MICLTDLIKVGLIGGLLSFDYVSGLRLMIHQPLIAAPLTGYLMGDFGFGVAVGVLLQLIYMGEISIGASRPDDVAIASVVSVAAGAHLGTKGAVAASIAVGVPFGHLGGLADSWVTKLNPLLARRIEGRIERGEFGGLWLFAMIAVVAAVAVSATISMIGVLLAGYAFEHLLTSPPEFVREGLSWSERLMPAIGIAVLLNSFQARSAKVVFIAAFLGVVLIASLLGLNLTIPLGVSVLTAALGIWMVRGRV
jgi:mannose/fructose/N-acetylgalactosamine-specific phosphotransferase system component IIC